MPRVGSVRRWVVSGFLVGCGLLAGGATGAQEPKLILDSPAAKAAPAGTLYLPPPPDDGLGCAPLTPATPPPACAPAAAGDRFAKLPQVAVFPRPGFGAILPTGPGYYSVAEWLNDEPRDTPPKYPYPRISPILNSFFDIDWRYLDNPDNTETDFWDVLKRRRFGPNDCCLVTAGGEIRARYNHEENSRLRGKANTYDLFRLRLYADVFLTERLRVFAEFLSSNNPNSVLPPLPIDRDPADFLNLFVDVNPFEVADVPVWVRIGRQELLYGSQRLISPLDWADTRRTFQGIKAFWHTEKDDLDAFLVQPVIPNKDRFDSVDNNILFAGLWYTHRAKPGNFFDAYYLMADNTNNVFEGRGGARGGQTVHTFGSRYTGVQDGWLWDVEGMLQCGEHVNQGLFAKAFTVGGGRHFADWWGTPTAWLYYDYASGTPEPGAGNLFQTFDQLYPFGHYYMGWIDLVGRKNINDVNAEITLYPTKWWLVWLQCHNFWLDSAKDALYSAGGVPLRQDKTGRAGNYVGTEFDLIQNFHLTKHSDILIAYGYMFAGGFIQNTAKTDGERKNPQALYIQYSYRW